MYCIGCGRQIEDGAKFCMYCGEPVPQRISRGNKQKSVPAPGGDPGTEKQARAKTSAEGRDVDEMLRQLMLELSSSSAAAKENEQPTSPEGDSAPLEKASALAQKIAAVLGPTLENASEDVSAEPDEEAEAAPEEPGEEAEPLEVSEIAEEPVPEVIPADTEPDEPEPQDDAAIMALAGLAELFAERDAEAEAAVSQPEPDEEDAELENTAALPEEPAELENTAELPEELAPEAEEDEEEFIGYVPPEALERVMQAKLREMAAAGVLSKEPVITDELPEEEPEQTDVYADELPEEQPAQEDVYADELPEEQPAQEDVYADEPLAEEEPEQTDVYADELPEEEPEQTDVYADELPEEQSAQEDVYADEPLAEETAPVEPGDTQSDYAEQPDEMEDGELWDADAAPYEDDTWDHEPLPDETPTAQAEEPEQEAAPEVVIEEAPDATDLPQEDETEAAATAEAAQTDEEDASATAESLDDGITVLTIPPMNAPEEADEEQRVDDLTAQLLESIREYAGGEPEEAAEEDAATAPAEEEADSADEAEPLPEEEPGEKLTEEEMDATGGWEELPLVQEPAVQGPTQETDGEDAGANESAETPEQAEEPTRPELDYDSIPDIPIPRYYISPPPMQTDSEPTTASAPELETRQFSLDEPFDEEEYDDEEDAPMRMSSRAILAVVMVIIALFGVAIGACIAALTGGAATTTDTGSAQQVGFWSSDT